MDRANDLIWFIRIYYYIRVRVYRVIRISLPSPSLFFWHDIIRSHCIYKTEGGVIYNNGHILLTKLKRLKTIRNTIIHRNETFRDGKECTTPRLNCLRRRNKKKKNLKNCIKRVVKEKNLLETTPPSCTQLYLFGIYKRIFSNIILYIIRLYKARENYKK